MRDRRQTLTGWGRTAPSVATVVYPQSRDAVAEAVWQAGSRGVLARGLGRSYGDAAQNAGGVVLKLDALDTMSDVDPQTGEVTCGAGLDLDRLIRGCLPRGWFVPVTPGTRQITVGGAVAADVHGKNHHRDGSIGAHVTRIELVDGSGEQRSLTPDDELFWATVGGMGLTGVITSVTLRMQPVDSAWIAVDTTRTRGLAATMDALRDGDRTHRYSVAWIDCLASGSALGRGVVTAGDHLAAADLPARIRERANAFDAKTRLAAPPWAPSHLLSMRQVAAFNSLYHARAPLSAVGVATHLAPFFHPLDAISGWNRLYGRHGFVQYQFVTPQDDLVERVLHELQRNRVPVFLAVLKRFGAGNAAPLSFPAAGWTLALDIPASTPGLTEALDALDEQVLATGGRVYLAKDARIRPAVLAAMYPRLDEWRKVRAAADPRGVFHSDLARRLAL
jgi:decaprenylphospho-beta-D-ribofuranose 2-oxidase